MLPSKAGLVRGGFESNCFIYDTNKKNDSLKKEQHENGFDCGPFDVNSKTTNQTALAVSLVCHKDQAHETAVAVRLIVSSPWLQPAN